MDRVTAGDKGSALDATLDGMSPEAATRAVIDAPVCAYIKRPLAIGYGPRPS